MLQTMRNSGKRAAGWLISRSAPRYRYDNCLFVLAHMRCGSTALSNVLCSRAEISGYGEAHVAYRDRESLGQLALNQLRRGGWKPGAAFQFDKILHSRHDLAVPREFFDARAIFVIRRPDEAIASIVRLFAGRERNEYASAEQAAAYYVERLARLEALWPRFPAHRRIGATHRELVGDPDGTLARISGRLGFDPPLANRYVSPPASRRGGGGDPAVSGQHTRIEPHLAVPGDPTASLRLPPALAREAQVRFDRLEEWFAQGGNGGNLTTP